VQFSKLRLSGFKSFLDPAEFSIDGGITGLVGPNGCGKSNVIEALRWVMGETSAKRMRGSEMDDVIFGGSSGRPARNIAEVTLRMDNSDRGAPAPFNDNDDVEITRRIERGHGSSYRINGKEVRARDVQLLFADMATGANSTAIVSQGRIGALIGAKPTERRTLLEEAAGIRGLHSRRHEAELRLKAAETNLERLEDVIGALEAQHQGLQKQARQANRYRRLSDHLRRHEAILLHLRWQDANAAVESAKQRLNEAEQVVHERTEAAASAAKRQADAASALPDLRRSETEAAAELQRVLVAERELENEDARVKEAQAAAIAQLDQIARDREREESLRSDADTAMQRLEAERKEIQSLRADETERLQVASDASDTAAATVEAKEADLSQMTEEIAAVDAQRSSLQRRINESRQRIESLQRRIASLEEETIRLKTEQQNLGDIAAADAAIADAEGVVSSARAASQAAETALTKVRETERQARQALTDLEQQTREALRAVEADVDKLSAEESALSALVERHDADASSPSTPVLSNVSVTAGYEGALGAAFGDELDAPADATSKIHWLSLPPFSGAMGLPKGAEPLSKFVSGPAALSRRLSQIGVVPDAEAGKELQSRLGPGQRLVSLDGGMWRWDGFTVSAGAETAAAQQMKHKNRLIEVRSALEDATKRLAEEKGRTEASVQQARAALETAEREIQGAAGREQATRRALQDAFGALDAARKEHAAIAGRTADIRSRLESATETKATIETDISESQDQISGAEQALKVLEDPTVARERVNRLRVTLAELRTDLLEKRGTVDRLRREAETRTMRLSAIAGEEISWRQRIEGAQQRLADLDRRTAQATEQKDALAERPAEIAEQLKKMQDVIGAAEGQRKLAADKLSVAEQEQTDADKALRETETHLAESREIRVRREAEIEQADQAAAAIAERIAEKLDTTPDNVLAAGGVEADEELPPRADVETKLERLTRERDNMGPVNLRAEQEAAELEEQIASMHTERDDLIAAISRLRQGINALNREGRERLLAAFEQVNQHFQDLFVRLFGGGEAKLALTEADDPLEAGLEIMASPPGKKMQIMSLLSGGEQALTALSLLFAVFLTNPAPICVLDEVDAPLDDTNVDRFCTLLDEIARSAQTRFVVVTHHRLTMARVDRLFGVTMAERGVSQLVSVDLQQAVKLRETA